MSARQPPARPQPSLASRLFASVKGVGAALILGANVLLIFSCMMPFALLKLCLPFAGVRKLLNAILNRLAETWIAINGWWIGLVGRVRWQIEGVDGLARDNWYIIGSNHQSWVDIFVLQKVLTGKVPLGKFFLKHELVYVPLMGLAWWALDFPFMRRGGNFARDLAATRKACERFRDLPTALINFLEGTRFTREKQASAKAEYRHLLPPKTGGLAMAIAILGDRFRSYLDVTIVYPDGAPSFWDLLCGRMRRVTVHVRALDIPLPPPGKETGGAKWRRELTAWMDDIWREKDRRIAATIAAAPPEEAQNTATAR